MIFRWLFFLSYLPSLLTNTIKLNTTNFIMLKGPITPEKTNSFLYEFNLLSSKDVYLYIDSPGGHIEEGLRIVNEVIQYNLTCIAEKAYSMAFVIFQSCKKRYVLPFGKLMQHQISFGIKNEKAKVENYIQFIQQMEDTILTIQSSKINISNDELKSRTTNEWWIFGYNTIREKCADEIVNVQCTRSLTLQNTSHQIYHYLYIYSKCPLVSEPIDKVKTKDEKKIEIFI